MGFFSASPGDESQTLDVEDVILHPMYDLSHAYQDIAVIKLKPNKNQLWKFTNESKLKNKGGIWQFSNTQWTLPPQGAEGVIETKNSSEVLGIVNLIPESGSVVLLESLDTKKNDVQKWFIGQIDKDWFTITNLKVT